MSERERERDRAKIGYLTAGLYHDYILCRVGENVLPVWPLIHDYWRYERDERRSNLNLLFVFLRIHHPNHVSGQRASDILRIVFAVVPSTAKRQRPSEPNGVTVNHGLLDSRHQFYIQFNFEFRWQQMAITQRAGKGFGCTMQSCASFQIPSPTVATDPTSNSTKNRREQYLHEIWIKAFMSLVFYRSHHESVHQSQWIFIAFPQGKV